MISCMMYLRLSSFETGRSTDSHCEASGGSQCVAYAHPDAEIAPENVLVTRTLENVNVATSEGVAMQTAQNVMVSYPRKGQESSGAATAS